MRVLLVEDDRKASRLLVRGLCEEGFLVDAAYSAEEADLQLAGIDYDVIILDCSLPGKDGLILCAELRDNGIQAPILMLTARDALQDRILGLNAGADDYLTKPFAFAELVARVRALLRRSGLTRPTVLRVADLTLEPHTHRVTRGDHAIDLTQKEYAILEILLRNAGEVVSRTRLGEQIWTDDRIGLDNLIDAHVRNLRRKVDRIGDIPLIQTVRGRGFRLGLEDSTDA